MRVANDQSQLDEDSYIEDRCLDIPWGRLMKFAQPPVAEGHKVAEKGMHNALDGYENHKQDQLNVVERAEPQAEPQQLAMQAQQTPQLQREPALLRVQQALAMGQAACKQSLMAVHGIGQQLSQKEIAMMRQMANQQQSQQIECQAQLETELADVDEEHGAEKQRAAMGLDIEAQQKHGVAAGAGYGDGQGVNCQMVTRVQPVGGALQPGRVQQREQLAATPKQLICQDDKTTLAARVPVEREHS